MSDDYTENDIPVEEIDADNFVIAGTGATQHEAEKIEEENAFSEIEPGTYLFKVTGFRDVKKQFKDAYIGNKKGSYVAYSLWVKFQDTNNPGNRIQTWMMLPPETPAELEFYNNGTKEPNGKAPGFVAKSFVHFLERLFPGQAYKSDGKGGRVMTDLARDLSKWKGRQIWATVEMGKASGKVNETTGEPYPARSQIKSFSYVPFVQGGPAPVTSKPNGRTAPPRNSVAAAQVREAELVTADAGLDDI